MLGSGGHWDHRPTGDHPILPGAHRPWLEADEPVTPYKNPEPQENIDRCLACELPDCRRCPWTGGEGKRKHALDEDRAWKLYRAGCSDERIANELGVSKGRVAYWRKKNRLWPNG